MVNFDKAADRRNTNCEKWDTMKEGVLPLWVADMDFKTVPEVSAGLAQFAQAGVFGYTFASDSLYQSIIDWEMNKHQLAVNPDEIVFIDGVVPAISVAIQAFTELDDAIVINTPVYPPFARNIKLNKRRLIENDLVIVDGKYTIDFDLLEEQFKTESVKMYVFCSPHNPGGRVWQIDELEKIGQLCKKYNVILVSDEIHQDFALFGNKHTTFLSVDQSFGEFAIVLSSATKTFNIAGTKNSFVIFKNEALKSKFQAVQLRNNQHEISSFGQLATELAYLHGDEWLEGLRAKIEENIEVALAFFEAKLPKIKAMKPEGTYLLWLDFSAYGLTDETLQKKLVDEAKVYLNQGISYGASGKNYIRMNLATSTEIVNEALSRIEKIFG